LRGAAVFRDFVASVAAGLAASFLVVVAIFEVLSNPGMSLKAGEVENFCLMA